MININLIANRRSRKLREMVMLRWAFISVILLLIAMFSLNAWELWVYSAAAEQLTRTQKTLTKIQEDKKTLDEIQAKVEEKRPQVILLKQAQQSQGAWLIILADLSRIVPSDVVLTSLSTGRVDKTMTLSMGGYAADEHTVGQFMMDLPEKTAWAGTPKLGTVSADEKDQGQRTVHFDLTVPIQGMLGGDL